MAGVLDMGSLSVSVSCYPWLHEPTVVAIMGFCLSVTASPALSESQGQSNSQDAVEHLHIWAGPSFWTLGFALLANVTG